MRNKKKQREYQAEYRLIHKDKLDAYAKEWRKNNPKRTLAISRKSRYIQHYGITPKEAEQLLIKQDGKCAVCNIQILFDGTQGGAHLDHDHESNLIRGILCQKCNLGLGHFKDNITTLFNAINYLREFRKRKFTVVEKSASIIKQSFINPFIKTAS